MKGVIRRLLLLPVLGILNQLYIFKKHMQSSFQFAIKSIISSQTVLPRNQSIGELFARKCFLKLFNQSREIIVD